MYFASVKVAHWAILLLSILQFPTARAIQRTHLQHNPFGVVSQFDLFLHQVHAWSGWIIGGLSAVMLLQRLRGKTPPLPAGMRRWQVSASVAGHILLYATLASLVVTGTGAMYLWQGFAPIHTTLLWIGVTLVVAHVLAALWHHFVRRDGLLWRILPQFRPRASSHAEAP